MYGRGLPGGKKLNISHFGGFKALSSISLACLYWNQGSESSIVLGLLIVLVLYTPTTTKDNKNSVITDFRFKDSGWPVGRLPVGPFAGWPVGRLTGCPVYLFACRPVVLIIRADGQTGKPANQLCSYSCKIPVVPFQK